MGREREYRSGGDRGCGLGCGKKWCKKWFQGGRQSKRMEVRAMAGNSLRREGGWVVWGLAKVKVRNKQNGMLTGK